MSIADLFTAGTIAVTITRDGDKYHVERRRMSHGITGGIVVERFVIDERNERDA